jgi:hypothetical protein
MSLDISLLALLLAVGWRKKGRRAINLLTFLASSFFLIPHSSLIRVTNNDERAKGEDGARKILNQYS